MDPFEPDQAGFSLANAVWLMELSRLVYRRDPSEPDPHPTPRRRFLEPLGLQETFFSRKDLTADTQAILVQSTNAPEWAALVFRGTERNATDLIADLALSLPLIGSGVVVHRGFRHALDIVWDDIERAHVGVERSLFEDPEPPPLLRATKIGFDHAPVNYVDRLM